MSDRMPRCFGCPIPRHPCVTCTVQQKCWETHALDAPVFFLPSPRPAPRLRRKGSAYTVLTKNGNRVEKS